MSQVAGLAGSELLRILIALGSTAVCTWAMVGRVNSATAALGYLLLVLMLATWGGLRESIVASFGSMLAYNYFFLPPVGTLTIADPQNWIALAVFLITAVSTSHLSANARRRAEEAGARQRELERIYVFSRALLLSDAERSVASQIAQRVAEAFDLKHVAFFESDTAVVWRVGDETELTLDDLRMAASTKPVSTRRVRIAAVQLGGRVFGSLGVGTGAQGPSWTALHAIAQLAAIAMERERSRESAARLEATRQSEQLKSTLLDAIAHEFKTPLTSIKAAVTSILSNPPGAQAELELLTVIDEESDRLTDLVTEATEVARIGAGQLRLRKQTVPLARLLAEAMHQVRRFAEGRQVEVTIDDGVADVEVDAALIELVFRQLLINACRYAPSWAAIRVSATVAGEEYVVHIANDGPPIAGGERSAIFEKFYRGREVRDRIPGTGLGLSIAREIVEAHGGRLWLDDESGHGVCFAVSMPIVAAVARPGQ